MKNAKPLFLVLLLATVAGCKPDPLGPARDVAYFKEHASERTDVIAKCDADPGQFDKHPNCVNARQAAWDASMKSDDNSVPRLPAAD